jgi:hypothetical protein
MPLPAYGVAIRQDIILAAFRQIIYGSLHSPAIIITPPHAVQGRNGDSRPASAQEVSS